MVSDRLSSSPTEGRLLDQLSHHGRPGWVPARLAAVRQLPPPAVEEHPPLQERLLEADEPLKASLLHQDHLVSRVHLVRRGPLIHALGLSVTSLLVLSLSLFSIRLLLSCVCSLLFSLLLFQQSHPCHPCQGILHRFLLLRLFLTLSGSCGLLRFCFCLSLLFLFLFLFGSTRFISRIFLSLTNKSITYLQPANHPINNYTFPLHLSWLLPALTSFFQYFLFWILFLVSGLPFLPSSLSL